MKTVCRKMSWTLAAVMAGHMAVSSASAAGAASPYEGSRFADVWAQVDSDPYQTLPQDKVSITRFFSGLTDLVLRNSRRTLSDASDVLPRFNKLLHPNGVCLKGTWNITAESPYTGAFSTGTQALIIARASTALSNTKTGQNRAFGLAGKLYPTADEQHALPMKTANFFTIEDLGGNRKRYFLDAVNSNDIIRVSPSLTAFFKGAEGLVVARDFVVADGSNLQTALIRELYPLGEMGLAAGAVANTPVWMKITGAADMPRIDASDFREELDLSHYPQGLRFDISVASKGTRFGSKEWQTIGFIEFTDSVVSDSCDHRLHFTHPKSRKRW
jgi:hypothetical protein